MGVRHKRMEQLDGQNSSFIEGEDDYNKSENYWRHGRIGNRNSQYLCANLQQNIGSERK